MIEILKHIILRKNQPYVFFCERRTSKVDNVIAFLLASAFFCYVVAGYPLLLGLINRFRARPVRKSTALKTVSVVIPVHNGAKFIRQKLKSVLALDYPRELIQVLVVSDGSYDETDQIVWEFRDCGVELIRIPKGGKPSALNAAFPRATGEILLLTDARQELEPRSLRKLIACYGDQAVGVVSGELIIQRGTRCDQANVGLYWRYESWIRDQLGSIDSMFGATGPFYTIRRDLVSNIPEHILLDDVYLPMCAFFKGYRLIVEKSARAVDYPTTLQAEFHRKVRTLAGNYQLIYELPKLLTSANRMWFHFVSYKVGRLLLPYSLIAIAVSSFFLPAPFSWLVIGMQLGFYSLALGDSTIPETFSLKRLSSPAATFVTMMAAVLCGLSVFFVNPQSLWKETKVAIPYSHEPSLKEE